VKKGLERDEIKSCLLIEDLLAGLTTVEGTTE
jgi:hypothetical protein